MKTKFEEIGFLICCIAISITFLMLLPVPISTAQQKASVSGVAQSTVSASFTGTATILPEPTIIITDGIIDASKGRKFYQFASGPVNVVLTNLTEGWIGVLYIENPWLNQVTWPTPFKTKGNPYSPTNDFPIAVFDNPQNKLILSIE